MQYDALRRKFCTRETASFTSMYNRLDIIVLVLIINLDILDYFQSKLLKYDVTMEVISQD
jgi:hypothetical protein